MRRVNLLAGDTCAGHIVLPGRMRERTSQFFAVGCAVDVGIDVRPGDTARHSRRRAVSVAVASRRAPVSRRCGERPLRSTHPRQGPACRDQRSAPENGSASLRLGHEQPAEVPRRRSEGWWVSAAVESQLGGGRAGSDQRPFPVGAGAASADELGWCRSGCALGSARARAAGRRGDRLRRHRCQRPSPSLPTRRTSIRTE